MYIHLKNFTKNRPEIIFFIVLIFISVSMINFNNQKRISLLNNYGNLINNVYFKKTTRNLINNLDPKFKNIDYVVQKGDTISNILLDLDIDDIQIEEIKKKLSKKIDISKIRENQTLSITINQSNKEISELI